VAGAEIGKFNDSAVRPFFSSFPIVPPFPQFHFTQQFADANFGPHHHLAWRASSIDQGGGKRQSGYRLCNVRFRG
jgi:hypothetical protein